METIEKEFQDCKKTLKIYNDLLGKTFNEIEKGECSNGNDKLIFKGEDSYMFYHIQDCCESVRIVDICGELSDLIDSPILVAEGVTRKAIGWDRRVEVCKLEVEDEGRWTFYKFATAKGSVTIRWLGESNGYYSEEVDFAKI